MNMQDWTIYWWDINAIMIFWQWNFTITYPTLSLFFLSASSLVQKFSFARRSPFIFICRWCIFQVEQCLGNYSTAFAVFTWEKNTEEQGVGRQLGQGTGNMLNDKEEKRLPGICMVCKEILDNNMAQTSTSTFHHIKLQGAKKPEKLLQPLIFKLMINQTLNIHASAVRVCYLIWLGWLFIKNKCPFPLDC